MKNLSLVVLAAGMGSRYGGLKQLDAVGPSGQTIMDYSVHDAVKAGFDEVIFVIRRDFESDFREKVLSKYLDKVKCSYVFQDMTACTQGIDLSIVDARLKPWGTAHATMVVENQVSGPFAVINADDFYGRDAFEKMAVFLKEECNASTYSMIGYELEKTLSENGTVNRGICSVKEGYLTSIVEGLKIQKIDQGYTHQTPNTKLDLSRDTMVSMNFFGFDTSIFDYMKQEFPVYANENSEDPKSEYYIPLVIDRMMNKELIKVKVIPTTANWIGVTYQEDKPFVIDKLSKFTEEGLYASSF